MKKGNFNAVKMDVRKRGEDIETSISKDHETHHAFKRKKPTGTDENRVMENKSIKVPNFPIIMKL